MKKHGGYLITTVIARAKPVAICKSRLGQILRYALRLTQKDGRFSHICAGILLAMTLHCPIILAQKSHTIDSLKKLITGGAADSSVCDAYLAWGEQVYLRNADTALILWQKAHDITKNHLDAEPHSLSGTLKIKYLSSQADALNNLGYIYQSQGDIVRGLDYFNKSLKIQEELGKKSEIADALNNIGYIYKSLGDIEKGLEYNHRSLKVREEIGDKRGVAYSLNNIGVIYTNQGDFIRGLECFNKSLIIREEMGDKKGVAQSLGNIGGIYDSQGDTSKALEYYYRSLRIREAMDDKRGVAVSLQKIGGTLCELDSIEKGMFMLKKALRISMEMNNKQWMGYTCDLIADWYLKSDLIDSAEHYGKWSMSLAREIEFPLNIKRAANKLTLVYRKQNKWEMALEMYEVFVQMHDSINNEKTQKATIRQQTKYEFEKAQLVKEQEEKEDARVFAEQTSRRDNLQYSVILIAILTLFGGVLALGFINVSERMAEGIIFFSFLIVFEFLLVLADPYIETWSGGAPGIKLLFNAGIAALVFPLHSFFETKLKHRMAR